MTVDEMAVIWTDIEELLGEYKRTAYAEIMARREANAIKSIVLFNNPLTGKNAEARAVESDVLLLASDEYQRAEKMADCTAIEMEAVRLEIGLMRGWLYAMGGGR